MIFSSSNSHKNESCWGMARHLIGIDTKTHTGQMVGSGKELIVFVTDLVNVSKVTSTYFKSVLKNICVVSLYLRYDNNLIIYLSRGNIHKD